jgi:AAA domain
VVAQTPFELVRQRLEEHDCKPRGNDRHLEARCPAHEDRNPSLSVTNGTTRVLLRCFAGCSNDDVIAVLGLQWPDLRLDDDKPLTRNAPDPVVATYDYVDEQGKLLFQVLRTASKRFRQRIPDPAQPDGWRWQVGATRRVPFRLPQVLQAAREGRVVHVVEGEKDVGALEASGAVATCNPGGAGKWRDDYSKFLAGADVVVVQDNDDPGRAHAAMVARSAEVAGARSVQIVRPRTGKDAYDHLQAGHSVTDFELVTPDLAPDLHEFLTQPDAGYSWVIDNLLERSDRMIVTGPEGHGKSLFNRMLAICAAAGLHPFTGRYAHAQRVLMVDCENSERQSRRHWRRLATVAADMCGRRVPDGGLRLIHRPEGLDLSREDASWLVEQVANHKPDMLVIGPLYRLHVADVNEETAARTVVRALDAARLTVGCALVLEAHSPHGEIGRARPLRPAGSSLFLRWPEFGFGLRPVGTVQEWEDNHVARVEQWRGPREERTLPKFVRWGDMDVQWPWVEYFPPSGA